MVTGWEFDQVLGFAANKVPPRNSPRWLPGRGALFLGAAAGDWYERGRTRLEISDCVPSLVRALADADGRVREPAAQAVGATGAAGAPAVPALIALLDSSSEGDRNTACMGLAGVGSAAKEALPALKKALTDPSATVRSFAKRAIERIER